MSSIGRRTPRLPEPTGRPALSRRNGLKPRFKRFLNAQDVTEIATRYETGESTQQVGTRYGISKSRVTAILREQGITIRRQGLNEQRISEAATLYAAGRSLAWLGARYGISHTTVAAALRRQGMQLRPAEDGVEPWDMEVPDGQPSWRAVTGPNGSASYALSDAKSGVAFETPWV